MPKKDQPTPKFNLNLVKRGPSNPDWAYYFTFKVTPEPTLRLARKWHVTLDFLKARAQEKAVQKAVRKTGLKPTDFFLIKWPRYGLLESSFHMRGRFP